MSLKCLVLAILTSHLKKGIIYISVSHKSERQVIVTLLELARIGYKYGLEPPSIIKIEKELEKEEQPEAPPQKPKAPPSARSRPLNLDEEVRFQMIKKDTEMAGLIDFRT
jgi:hypothetical protein